MKSPNIKSWGKSIKLSLKEAALFSHSWQLSNSQLIDPLIIESMDEITIKGNELRDLLKEGTIERFKVVYVVSWLTLPASCFNSKEVTLRFRKFTPMVDTFNRVLIKAITN